MSTHQNNWAQCGVGPVVPEFEAVIERYPRACYITSISRPLQSTARSVLSRGDRTHYEGLFASRRNEALIPYESSLEKDCCLYFESEPDIQSYWSQPLEARIWVDGRIKMFYPDFLIKTSFASVLVDVRYQSRSNGAKFIRRCNALKDYARLRGYQYRLLTEHEIWLPRLANVKWLLSLATGRPSTYLIDAVLRWLPNYEGYFIGEVLDISRAYPAVWSILAECILDRVLFVDIDGDLRSQRVQLCSNKPRFSKCDR